ncbi:MAG: ROK family protein [Coprobacillus cateniformis]|uniref:ROK family protein n=1 Tax=Longibaculum muris TaxID=1796628 RepID=UPI003AB4949F|nr:ROK family protein [Coprobacillus cateniformis]
MNYLGIDIGGTFIKYAIVDQEMRIIDKWKKETQRKSSVQAFYDYVCEGLDTQNIAYIGVSAPGVIAQNSMVMSETSSNTKIMYHTYIAEEIEKRLHIKTSAINDAKAAGLCELKMGVSKNTQSSAYMIIGTGIGGCLCDSHHIINGIDCLAGELSCLPFCIQDGKIVSASHYASMTALIDIYNQLSQEKLRYGKDISQKYLQHDHIATKAMQQWYLNICFVLNSLVLSYNPEVICLGGGISEEEWFIKDICETFEQHFPARFQNLLTTKIKACQHHNDANILGAILHVLSKNS